MAARVSSSFTIIRARPPARALRVIVPVVALAVATLVYALATIGQATGRNFVALGLLVAAATLAEAFPVPIERVDAGETSFATVFIAGGATIYGWQWGAIIGVVAMALIELWRCRPLFRQAFNASLYGLAGAAAGLATLPLPSGHGARPFVASASFYACDIVLLAIVVRVVDRERGTLYRFFRSTFVPFLIMLSLTGAFVHLWNTGAAWSLLIVAPMVVIGGFQRRLLAAFAKQRTLDKLKDEFVATVSHELRTPLTSVYGGAATLSRIGLDHERAPELLAVIQRESARLARMVDDVLWASRDYHSKAPAAEIDLRTKLEEVVGTFEGVVPENLTVAVEVSGRPVVWAKKDELRRAVTNLLENAIKYSPDGGTVTLRALDIPSGVRIEVSDEGLGVPDEDRERIFEKFTRLDPLHTRGIQGTGLGLHVCKTLVEDMHGEIHCGPNRPRGSVFTIDIPSGKEV